MINLGDQSSQHIVETLNALWLKYLSWMAALGALFLCLHSSIALTSTLCRLVISEIVWHVFGLFRVLWGVSTYYLSMERVLTADPGLYIWGKGPPGWKCKSICALGQKRACLHTRNSRISNSLPGLRFSRLFTHYVRVLQTLRWCDELHNVQLGLPLRKFKQPPTREITVTNGDRPDFSFSLWLSFSLSLSLSLFSLRPSLMSPISKISIQYRNALLAWQITMPCCQGKKCYWHCIYLSIYLFLSLSPYEN